MLLSVPNVSEGRDPEAVRAIGEAFCAGGAARLLDVHTDPDHHRSVLTLAGEPGALGAALAAGAPEVLARIDLRAHEGAHPRIGALDVAPVVFLDPGDRGAACAEALIAADGLARLGLPVFLYGALGEGRTRAQVRRGGPAGLARRLAARELVPDLGPGALHATGGATLVGARPPLVAFNVVLDPPATLDQARAVAAAVREGGADGLPGVRAIGVALRSRGTVQVSMNVEDPFGVPLALAVAAVGRHAPVRAAELVGLAPAAALEGFPPEVPLAGFDPARHLIESALARTAAPAPGG